METKVTFFNEEYHPVAWIKGTIGTYALGQILKENLERYNGAWVIPIKGKGEK